MNYLSFRAPNEWKNGGREYIGYYKLSNGEQGVITNLGGEEDRIITSCGGSGGCMGSYVQWNKIKTICYDCLHKRKYIYMYSLYMLYRHRENIFTRGEM